MSSATSKATAHGDGAPPARRVPPAPSLGASIAVHARLQVLRLRRSAKLKLAVGATLPMVAAVALSANLGDDAVGALRGGYKFALFLLLGYLLPFLFASGAISEEVESRTFTYLASRPASRLGMVVGKWLTATLFSAALLGGAAVLMHISSLATSPTVFVDELGLLGRTLGAVLLLSAGYSALTMCFGALVPPAAGIVGGLYLAIFEFIMGEMGPGYLPLLTMHHHALLLSGTDSGLEPVVELPIAFALMAGFTLVWLALTAVAVVPREFREGSG
ncbi:MAG: ABC transporter permease [Polyangiales bacterium]|nr:ABC transporter permease [Myxococcales bacterium]MCB9656296.1 ABC transporter permease [Sandaracinaceae bacterium]